MKGSLANGLATFQVVARYSTLTQAAKALHLTTGAVSQQLLQLELLLGFKVFIRHSRGIRLTAEGKQLAAAVTLHYSELERVIDKLRQPEQAFAEIRLKLTPSFAFKWLVPRLESFHRQFPHIPVLTFAEGALVDSDNRDYDLAIDYGPFPYHRAGSELLFEEYLLPVMSPAYAKRHPELASSHAAWQAVTLLHDAMPWQSAPRDYEWLYWASLQRMDIETNRGHFFNRTDMAMSAAEAGVGVAMARTALIGDELDAGRLVSPFQPLAANAGYFLLTRESNDSTETFTQWLRALCQQRGQ
ncbi:LysR substrate-binding domain-containing protein [Vibrio proteolyticus]